MESNDLLNPLAFQNEDYYDEKDVYWLPQSPTWTVSAEYGPEDFPLYGCKYSMTIAGADQSPAYITINEDTFSL